MDLVVEVVEDAAVVQTHAPLDVRQHAPIVQVNARDNVGELV